MAKILRFPERPIDVDAVRLDRDEPCLVLILPIVRIEGLLTPSERFGRFLNAVLDGERKS